MKEIWLSIYDAENGNFKYLAHEKDKNGVSEGLASVDGKIKFLKRIALKRITWEVEDKE